VSLITIKHKDVIEYDTTERTTTYSASVVSWRATDDSRRRRRNVACWTQCRRRLAVRHARLWTACAASCRRQLAQTDVDVDVDVDVVDEAVLDVDDARPSGQSTERYRLCTLSTRHQTTTTTTTCNLPRATNTSTHVITRHHHHHHHQQQQQQQHSTRIMYDVQYSGVDWLQWLTGTSRHVTWHGHVVTWRHDDTPPLGASSLFWLLRVINTLTYLPSLSSIIISALPPSPRPSPASALLCSATDSQLTHCVPGG